MDKLEKYLQDTSFLSRVMSYIHIQVTDSGYSCHFYKHLPSFPLSMDAKDDIDELCRRDVDIA